jgi:type I restriction enzyme, S subunit
MNITKGYKNTEVGVIPEDWDVKTYDDIFNFLTTASYSRAELTEVDNVKYVHYGDIHTKWNFFVDIEQSNLPTIKDEQIKTYHLIKDGDIIMADASEDYSGIGKSVEVKNLGSVKAISGLHTFLLRDKNEVFVNGFKGYIHFNKVVKTQFDRLATGLKVYGLSKGNLKVVQIPVPTLAEQTRIAAALSDADDLISSLETLIAKKRDIKQGIMQTLLQPKEGWEVKRLGDVATIVRGASPRPIEDPKWFDENSSIGWVRISDVTKSIKILTATTQKLSELGIQSSRYVEKENLIMSICATVGRPILTKINVCIHDGFVVFRNPQVEINYLYYFLSFIEKDWGKNGQTGSQMNLNATLINTTKIPVPPLAEQTRIATILSDMDAEILGLETKLDKYRQIKLGMMQNLLTGKIRLL